MAIHGPAVVRRGPSAFRSGTQRGQEQWQSWLRPLRHAGDCRQALWIAFSCPQRLETPPQVPSLRALELRFLHGLSVPLGGEASAWARCPPLGLAVGLAHIEDGLHTTRPLHLAQRLLRHFVLRSAVGFGAFQDLLRTAEERVLGLGGWLKGP